MLISRECMAGYVRDGRARPWQYPVGRHQQLVWTAAELDGDWYILFESTDHYQQAPDAFAALLTAMQSSVDVVASGSIEQPRRDLDDYVNVAAGATGRAS